MYCHDVEQRFSQIRRAAFRGPAAAGALADAGKGPVTDITLSRWEKFCFAMLDLPRRWGWIVHNNEKICPDHAHSQGVKCEKMLPGGQRTIGRHIVISLYAACTGRIQGGHHPEEEQGLCLDAACTGCIRIYEVSLYQPHPLPRRCLHGVHHEWRYFCMSRPVFASALPARGASAKADKLRHTIL